MVHFQLRFSVKLVCFLMMNEVKKKKRKKKKQNQDIRIGSNPERLANIRLQMNLVP